MSVVVFAGGVLAADSRAYGGHGCTSPGTKAKVHRLADGRRVGVVSADLGEPERFLAWLRAGEKPEAWKDPKPEIRAILVETDGSIRLFDGSIWASGPIQSDGFAIGSGAPYALGALSMGADACQAVRVAIEHDPHCGGPVTALEA